MEQSLLGREPLPANGKRLGDLGILILERVLILERLVWIEGSSHVFAQHHIGHHGMAIVHGDDGSRPALIVHGRNSGNRALVQ